jgi:uncharacterized protein
MVQYFGKGSMPYPPLNAVRKSWLLASSIYSNRRLALRWKNKIRFSAIACVNFHASLDWYERLESVDMRAFLEKHSFLVFKPMRVYMSTQWGMIQRINVIWDTYQLIRKFSVLRNAILNTEGSVIAQVDLAGYGEIRVVICYKHALNKDGELMVVLKSRLLQKDVYKMALAFEQKPNGEHVCYIGSIQGGVDKDDIKVLTKAMHGLRPSSLMIFIAQELNKAMGIKITNLLGLGGAIHPIKKKYMINLSFVHKINFDYDSFWIELGGSLRPDGCFELPLTAGFRENEEIKSKKRAMYQRRYALMRYLSVQIHDSMAVDSCTSH